MAATFNPPPNWPPPPPGWRPPAGWRPDPAWGPPPAGWQLWIDVPAGDAGGFPTYQPPGTPQPESEPAPDQGHLPPSAPAGPSTAQGARSGDAVGWLVAFLPVLTCSLACFAPPLRAALQARSRRFRTRMFVVAALVQAWAFVGFAIIGTAPEGPDGSITGWQAPVGVLSWLSAIATAVAIGIVHRRPHDELAGTALETARREARERYRALVARDPAMALRINVGRPDLPRDYDDGGLLDLNHLDAGALVSHAHLPADEARRVVATRASLGTYANLTQVSSYANLSPASADRLQERAVFL